MFKTSSGSDVEILMGLVVQSARLRTISILPIARMFCDLATCGGLVSSNGTSDCL